MLARNFGLLRCTQPIALLALTLLLVLFTGACEPDVQTDAETEMETDTGLVRDPVMVDEGRRVHVTLDEFVIDMTDSVEAGVLVFEADNRGTMEHSLAVEGENVHQTIPSDFRPAETMELTVELSPGTYRMYCPVDDHAERGMEKTITVR